MAGDPPTERPSRRRVVTPDEARLWRAVIRDVVPLAGRTHDDEPPPDECSPLPVPPPSSPLPLLLPPPPPRPAAVPPHELRPGQTPGIDRRTAERMKKGEMQIDGRLDLHGLTQDAAHGALSAFIGRAYDSGRRCLLVITGKGLREGTGILRTMVPRWLNQAPCRERVLGFSSARPQHGGDGALYVLVKRRRG